MSCSGLRGQTTYSPSNSPTPTTVTASAIPKFKSVTPYLNPIVTQTPTIVDAISLPSASCRSFNSGIGLAKSRSAHPRPYTPGGPVGSTGETRLPATNVSKALVCQSRPADRATQLPPGRASAGLLYGLSLPKSAGLLKNSGQSRPHGFGAPSPTSCRSSSILSRRVSFLSERSNADRSRSAFLGEPSK